MSHSQCIHILLQNKLMRKLSYNETIEFHRVRPIQATNYGKSYKAISSQTPTTKTSGVSTIIPVEWLTHRVLFYI